MTKELEKIIDMMIQKFPNQLPTTEINSYELGRLIGHQEALKHLINLMEKEDNALRDIQPHKI